MIDLYEPDMTVKKLDKIFDDVKRQLLPFLTEVKQKQNIDNSFLQNKFPKDQQWKFGLDVLKSIGFDFSRGRQDISSHPFTIGFGPDDVRVTTRIDENDFCNMTWSCIHEGGHALYEQGLSPKDYGLPSGSATSLGIHESQSRLWENNVGRSKAFWKYQLPKLKKYFPNQLQGVSLDQFFKAINFISPGLIRTEADELHYHLHVMIRYEIEKEIFQSKITAKDIRAMWNDSYKKYIGVKVKNDTHGILQDVHWSHGSFGYFPTYSLGSFYAAQLFATAEKSIPALSKSIEQGDLKPLNQWLAENIYKHGKLYNAEDLCKKATGSSLDLSYFMNYVSLKYDSSRNHKQI
jgi:carboxypeptidase Taq